ncbi:hypothetical protein B0H67DRAFT_549803 [Lasiosphaeris hirsuta]|uniref:DUF3533 domain-containing protein n=1 Tax=Lasiosphaeris hirsuta TaxID=260670 RepID=A0AA40BE28_9PEZI|nr:hypothetical protein B0H67DRAFT_549803 [Lasiosphaeris hirsuta]
MPSLRTLYPRAANKRLPSSDPVMRNARFAFFKAAGTNFLYLQLLFLGLFCYIFGSLFQQNSHIHNIGIVLVDYDGGAIGDAIRAAYTGLQATGFPTLTEQSPSEFETTGKLWEAVCHTTYWGALYVAPGASGRLHDALTGGAAASSAYNRTDVLTYIWNEALYPAVVDSAVSGSIQALTEAARIAYSTGNGTGDITSVSGPALSVLANPWELQSVNMQPTSQGSRVIYNTVVIILVLIQEFFYLGTINGLYAQFKLYGRLNPARIIAVRFLISLAYTFIGSLCVIGAIFAFKSGWDINGNQFVLSWMALWLFAHTNFLTFDIFTIYLGPPFIPMSLIAWVILNVTSVILPFDVSPGFYRVGYLFPAHEVYQILTDIWSRGCNPQLRYALPILFAWEILGLSLSSVGVYRRSHYAALGEERQTREFKERLDAAVEYEMSRLKKEGEKQHREQVEKPEPSKAAEAEPHRDPPSGASAPETDSDDSDMEASMREELADIIERVNTRQQQRRRSTPIVNFGPSFDLPFNHDNDDDDDEIR